MTDKNKSSIGEIIRQRRKAKGLTQSELGELLGVGNTSISKYEKNEIKAIPLDVMYKIADALDINLLDLGISFLPLRNANIGDAVREEIINSVSGGHCAFWATCIHETPSYLIINKAKCSENGLDLFRQLAHLIDDYNRHLDDKDLPLPPLDE